MSKPNKQQNGGQKSDDPVILHGSNTLPAEVTLIDGVFVALGAVVSRAHAESGLSAEEWNALPESERDEKLALTVDQLRAAAQAQMDAEREEKRKAESVEALVLSDSIYGKCGEVKLFHKSEVEAIAAAGYIDPHPNAVKSAKA